MTVTLLSIQVRRSIDNQEWHSGNRAAGDLVEYEPINESWLWGLTRSQETIQVYAPTSLANEEVIDLIREKLDTTVKRVRKRNIMFVMWDFNEKKSESEQQITVVEQAEQVVQKYDMRQVSDAMH